MASQRQRKQIVLEHKMGKCCVLCGTTGKLCFHHRDSVSWKLCVTWVGGVGNGAGWRSEEALLEEIAKCDLVCSSCHARYHSWKSQNNLSERFYGLLVVVAIVAQAHGKKAAIQALPNLDLDDCGTM